MAVGHWSRSSVGVLAGLSDITLKQAMVHHLLQNYESHHLYQHLVVWNFWVPQFNS